MEKSLKKVAINYGVYLGLILTSITVIAYAVDLELFTKWWFGIIMLVIIVTVGIVSISKAKGLLNGFISFKQAFSSYFIPIAVGIIISSLVSMLLFNVVDTEASQIIQDKSIEASIEMMEGFGTPQAAIDEQVATMRETNQFGTVSLLKGIAWQLLFYSIIGLIIAAIMKKKDPNAE